MLTDEHYLETIAPLIGVPDDWQISINEHDSPSPDNPSAEGTTLNDHRYRQSQIIIQRGLEGRHRQQVLLHELWHVALAGLDRIVEGYIINGMVPEASRELALAMYIDELENVVVKLTDVFTPYAITEETE